MPSRFHERFEITIGLDDVKERFVNRIGNRIFNEFFEYRISAVKYELLKAIADELGDWFTTRKGFEDYTKSDFHKTLQALEGSRRILIADLQLQLDALITKTLNDSELDLGVRYENGVFVRTGARLLDRKLVNESLRWLSDKKYESVLEPFSKGLEHLLKSEKYPAVFSDVVTDMYEALEALAKIVTDKDKELSANAELFLKKLAVSEAYKKILKEYISYANKFRHAAATSAPKPNLSIGEVESFTYLTGVFIRLTIQAS